MTKILALKIDVTKIDKTRLFKGKSGTYLDAIIRFNEDQPSEYGDHGMVIESVTKEEKAAGNKGTILGNVKVIATYDDDARAPRQQSKPAPPDAAPDEDDIPF